MAVIHQKDYAVTTYLSPAREVIGRAVGRASAVGHGEPGKGEEPGQDLGGCPGQSAPRL